MLYWNCCLIKTLCLVITEENSKSFRSNLHLILVTRHFGDVNSSKSSQMCQIMVYGSRYCRKQWQPLHFLSKKHGKYDDNTMIMLWIMENMVIIPWSAMNHDDHAKKHGRHAVIMAWSWRGSHVFPTLVYRKDPIVTLWVLSNVLPNSIDCWRFTSVA